MAAISSSSHVWQGPGMRPARGVATIAVALLGTDLRSTGLAIWLAEADGAHARALVPAAASFPLWLPTGAA